MGYDSLRLEKGMYQEHGRSFSQVLESIDPSGQYYGTPLEGLDAFQRQLKRFNIKVHGVKSDTVEKFFSTADLAVLFPEYVSRVVRNTGIHWVIVSCSLTSFVLRAVQSLGSRMLSSAGAFLHMT